MTISTEDPTDSQQDPELPEDSPDPLWDRPLAKGIFVAVVALALILVAIAVGPHFASGGSGPKTAPQLATAAVRSFPVTESATGTVVPASQIGVNFAAGGTISAIDTQVGAKVTKGTILAQLDSTQARNSVAQAQAQLASAQTSLAQAQAGTASNNPTLQANLSSAEAVFSQTQSAVAATNDQDTTIVAADNQQVATAQARFNADGCAAANPPNAQACAADQAALTTAQNKLQLDQAQAASDQANGELRITNAEGQVNQAQAALQTASGPDATQVASAQAAVASANFTARYRGSGFGGDHGAGAERRNGVGDQRPGRRDRHDQRHCIADPSWHQRRGSGHVRRHVEQFHLVGFVIAAFYPHR